VDGDRVRDAETATGRNEGAVHSMPQKKSEVRRKQILDAAIFVFAEKGFHTTRVSDIAERAGVAYGLVYHYFRNKDEILRVIFL